MSDRLYLVTGASGRPGRAAVGAEAAAAVLAAGEADSDACAARGALVDDGRQLSALIGRPTTPMAETVARAVAEARAA